MTHRASRVLLVVGLLAFSACGGGSGSPTAAPTPTPVPTPLPPVVVAQRTGYSLESGYIAWLPFPTTRAGVLEATVDWTSSTNDIDVYLVKGECTFQQLDAGQCEVLAFAETSTKPEKLRYESAAASTYTIFIYNGGPADESVSFQVVLSASMTAAQPQPVASAVAGVSRVRR